MASMTGKRKRESMDQGGPVAPPPPGPDYRGSPNDNFDPSQFVNHHHLESDMPPHFADALVQHNAGDHTMHHGDPNGQSATDTANAALHYSMTVAQPGEDTFLQEAAVEAQHHREPSATLNFGDPTGHQSGPSPYEFSPLDQLKEPSQQPEPPQQQQLPPQAQQQQPTPTPTGPERSPPVGGPPTPNKPAVGTDAWHKVRKDNHKEVERRRRETINEGINEIAKIVPGCEKNKGSILQRAVQFIQQLKENESQNIEKWTLEKLLTEQAISELSNIGDKLKEERNKAYIEIEAWKRAGERAGVRPTEEDMAAAAATINADDEEM